MTVNRASPSAALLLFVGVASLYYSLSSGAIGGMGYTGEEMKATREIITNLKDWVHGRRASSPVDWPRHGAVAPIVHLPFMLPFSAPWGDRMLTLEPVLATAGLVLLTFVWSSELSKDRRKGFVLALAAGFCTLLWPYAYIGLETTQSLALLGAAFLALTGRRLTWPLTVCFAFASAVALTTKLNGIVLLPTILYLSWRLYLAPETERWRHKRYALAPLLTTIAIVGIVWLLNAHCRAVFWTKLGGPGPHLRFWRVSDPIAPALNFLALVASPNKGLIVYAPITLLALLGLPRVFREERPLAIFATLTLVGLVASLSLLRSWADETWGPRYLHCTICPLVLCMGVLWRTGATRRTFRLALAAAVILGFGVAFLGMFFYYGRLPQTARSARQNTIEAYQGDPVWNHIRFNARLLSVWLRSRQTKDEVFWSPIHTWYVVPPPDPPPWPEVNLTQVAVPQPEMIRCWSAPKPGAMRWIWLTYVGSFGLGLLLLTLVPFRLSKSEQQPTDVLR